MFKLFWIFPIFLFHLYKPTESLECYHCYSNFNGSVPKDNFFVPCNDKNVSASNTWICPNPKAECIYELLEIQATKEKQIWRTCSNGITDPCDPNALPPGMKMLKCSHCNTDKCNLQFSEEKQNSFNININANINLYIRQ